MALNNDSRRDGDTKARQTTAVKYEQPRIEKSRQLTEVTGTPAPVPSGAPVQAYN